MCSFKDSNYPGNRAPILIIFTAPILCTVYCNHHKRELKVSRLLKFTRKKPEVPKYSSAHILFFKSLKDKTLFISDVIFPAIHHHLLHLLHNGAWHGSTISNERRKYTCINSRNAEKEIIFQHYGLCLDHDLETSKQITIFSNNKKFLATTSTTMINY